MGSLPETEIMTEAAQQQQQPQPLRFVVDKNGSGHFTTVQDAVNAVPDRSPTRTVITIRPGTYREKVLVEQSKVNLSLEGEDYRNTSIVWDDNHKRVGGTKRSASVTINANNFVASNLSFRNTAPPPSQVGQEDGQAVALLIQGDEAAFYNCGFYSFQDTLYDSEGRHFFRDCFIQGYEDFICGEGQSLYVGCRLDCIRDEGNPNSGAITAQRGMSADKTGFSFVNCTVTGNVDKVLLGRAWGPYSRVVFAKTCICTPITSERWINMPPNHFTNKTVFYGEYCCKGQGASSATEGELWKRLTDDEAAQFMDISFIKGRDWALPPVVGHIDAGPCGSSGADCNCGNS